MAQQDIFGRDGGIGLELEHPMAVLALRRAERGGGARDRAFETRISGRGSKWRPTASSPLRQPHRPRPDAPRWRRIAARPRSSRAGRSAVQSPARSRFASGLRRLAGVRSCSGVAAKVARRSLDDLPGRQRRVGRRWIAATSAQIRRASGSRSSSHERVGGADRHRQAIGKGEDPFAGAADHADHPLGRRPAARGGNGR